MLALLEVNNNLNRFFPTSVGINSSLFAAQKKFLSSISHDPGCLRKPYLLGTTTSSLERIIEVEGDKVKAKNRYRQTPIINCPLDRQFLLDEISDVRLSSKYSYSSMIFLKWWAEAVPSSEIFIQEKCDEYAARYFEKYQVFDLEKPPEIDTVAGQIAAEVLTELSGSEDIGQVKDRIYQLSTESAKIALDVYYKNLIARFLFPFIESLVRNIQHTWFVKDEKLTCLSVLDAKKVIDGQLNKLPFYHLIDQHQLTEKLNQFFSDERYSQLVSKKGGRFQANKCVDSMDVNGLSCTQIRTDDGFLFELLNTLDQNQVQEVNQAAELDLCPGKKVLGQGSFGRVRLARLLSNGEIYAVKKIESKSAARVEIAQHKKIGSHALFATAVHIAQVKIPEASGKYKYKAYIFMPLSNAGNGREANVRVHEDKSLSEQDKMLKIKENSFSCLKAVAALHEIGFVHRDIKPDNFLHSKSVQIQDSQKELVRLADFGFAEKGGDIDKYTLKYAGTPGFLPPEFKKFNYNGFKHDSFSLGMTLLEMKLGTKPMKWSYSHLQLPSGDYRLKFDIYKQCSGVFLDRSKRELMTFSTLDEIIAGLLDTNPAKRLTPEEALNKPYFQDLKSD